MLGISIVEFEVQKFKFLKNVAGSTSECQNYKYKDCTCFKNVSFNPLKPELISICYLLALLGVHHFLHVSRIRVKLLTFRLLMSYVYIYIYIYIYIYMEHPFLMFLDHTQRRNT